MELVIQERHQDRAQQQLHQVVVEHALQVRQAVVVAEAVLHLVEEAHVAVVAVERAVKSLFNF